MQVGLMLGFERGPRRIQIVRVIRLRCIGTIRGLSGGTGELATWMKYRNPVRCPAWGLGRSPSALLFWFSVITVTLIRRPANG